jgi:hypothetical protein
LGLHCVQASIKRDDLNIITIYYMKLGYGRVCLSGQPFKIGPLAAIPLVCYLGRLMGQAGVGIF